MKSSFISDDTFWLDNYLKKNILFVGPWASEKLLVCNELLNVNKLYFMWHFLLLEWYFKLSLTLVLSIAVGQTNCEIVWLDLHY